MLQLLNPVEDDFRTLVHECGHAVAAVHYGAKLLRIIGHRWHTTGDERGSVEYLMPPDATPEHNAVVLLAGRLCAEGIHVPGNTDDERQAKQWWAACGSPPGWLDARRAEAWALLQRRDVDRAMRELVYALRASAYVLGGLEAERVIAEALAG